MKAEAMSTVRIEIDEPLAVLLQQTNQPVQAAAREMIVLELYRRGAISSGKAADLLGSSGSPSSSTPRSSASRTWR